MLNSKKRKSPVNGWGGLSNFSLLFIFVSQGINPKKGIFREHILWYLISTYLIKKAALIFIYVWFYKPKLVSVLIDSVSLSLLRIIISGSDSGISLSLLTCSGWLSLDGGMGCLVSDTSGSNSVVSSCSNSVVSSCSGTSVIIHCCCYYLYSQLISNLFYPFCQNLQKIWLVCSSKK